jgi:predicted CXXCH cytochrome family protein
MIMKKLPVLIICLATAIATMAIGPTVNSFGAVPISTCTTSDCHDDGSKFAEIASAFESGIHSEKGITCNDCHQLTAAHYEDGDIVEGTEFPMPWQQPELCGSCHSKALVMKRFLAMPDITAEEIYWTSQHGGAMEKLESMVNSSGSNLQAVHDVAANVATCSSCHGVHGIEKIDTPRATVFPTNVANTCGTCHGDEERMRAYFQGLASLDPSLAVDEDRIQLLSAAHLDYNSEGNVHRQALEDKGMLDAPTCNDCHGNHGATPPGAFGAVRVAEVCGSCHAQTFTHFSESVKADIFDDDEYRDCFACHGNHNIARPTDDMIGLEEGAICYRCHSDPDFGGQETITSLKFSIASLITARDHALHNLEQAEQKGMEVDSGYEKLVELNTVLISARGKIHTFDDGIVREHIKPGLKLAEEANEIASEAIDHLNFRRVGLGASSFLILLLAGVIVLKIRQLEK